MAEAESEHAPLEAQLPKPPSDNEEDDVCRVCRSEGDEEMPLIFPCKCSGSVRYVHAECLKEWLAASQKKHCEICGYKYHFTKVYSDYIPSSIPVVVYMRQGTVWITELGRRIFRLWLATNTWLILLPALNMSSLGTLLWAADLLSPSPPPVEDSLGNTTAAANSTISRLLHWDDETREAMSYTFSHPVSVAGIVARDSWTRWNNGEDDTIIGYIFRGQVLTVTLAAVMLGLVLTREWMAQHVIGDTPKPPSTETTTNPEDYVVLNGIVYRKKWDAYMVFVDDENLSPHANLRRKVAWTRAIVLISEAIRNDRPQDVRMMDLRTFMQGSPLVKNDLDPHSVEVIMAAEGRVGDLLSRDPATHRAISILFMKMNVAHRAEPVRKSGDGSSGPKRQKAVPTSNSEEDLYDFLEQNRPETPPVDQSTLPPRPCNADVQGFEKKVSYAAPELLDDDANPKIDKGKGVATEKDFVGPLNRNEIAGPASEIHGDYPEEIAKPENAEDADGWVTEGDDGDDDGITSKAVSEIVTPPTRSDLGKDISESSTSEVNIASSNPTQEAKAGRPRGPVRIPYYLLDNDRWSNESARGSPTDEENAPSHLEVPALADIARGADLHIPQPELDADITGEDDDEEDDHENEEAEVEEPAAERNDDQDEEEALNNEDWNGVLEVIGLIGPIQNLAQNVCFGFILVGASMSILVGIPIWVGRVFLSIDYWHSATYSTTLVIKGIRLIFDPVFRVIYDILTQVVFLPALASVKALEKIVADSAGLGDATFPRADWLPSIPAAIRETATSRTGDFFASIGQTTHDYVTRAYHMHGAWSAKLLVTGTLSDRVWTMVYGYGVILAGLVFLALNPAGFRGQVGSSLSAEILNHAQFAKLAFFMFTELVIFPTTIGSVIQVCIVPIIPAWSLEKLVEWFCEVPFGALFTTWIIGTSFMFVFAGVLQALRRICRKGVLFFIRDPSERTYNPVKDILERPTASQLRKLGISAIMYTIVAFFLFGAASWGLSIAPLNSFKLLPFRAATFKSVSTVPFELLFFAIAVGPTLTGLRISHRGRRLMARWWTFTARAFNLKGLLTDHARKPPIKDSSHVLRVWQVIDVIAQIGLGRYDNAETWARVPASDSVVLLKPEVRQGRGVFVRLDNFGQAITPKGKLLMMQQDQAARDANRDPKVDYKVVWLPRYWRTRVHSVIFTALVLGGTVLALTVFAPLVVGRLILDRAMGEPIHDGYNWLSGVYVIWTLCWLGQRVKKTIVLSQLAVRLRRSGSSTRAKRALFRALQRVYILVTLYLVLPALVGIAWELYIAMPVRYGTKSYTPVLHFWEAWAMGLVLLLAYVAVTHDSDHPPRHEGQAEPPIRGGQQMRECYRTSFTVDLITVHDSTYMFAGFMVLLNIGPSLIDAIPAYFKRNGVDANAFSIIYRFSHPLLLTNFLAFVCRKAIMRKWSQLRQLLIDAEYVLEERVENYEPAKKKKAKAAFKGDPRIVEDTDEEDDPGWEDVDDN